MESEDEEYFCDEQVDEQNSSDDAYVGGYEGWWPFDSDDDEEEEPHEDEEEDEEGGWIPLMDDHHEADIDEDDYDDFGWIIDEDEDDEEGGWIPLMDDHHEADIDEDEDEDDDDDGGGGGEANETGIDGGDEGEPAVAEIAGGDSWTGSAPEYDRSNSPDCPICFKPWTADGPHRVCCFPCGHVHGRSCLETWLQRCGETNGKCPQCNMKFSRHAIINLYAPSVVIPTVRPYETQIHELSSRRSNGSTSGRRHLISSNLVEERHGCAQCSELHERVMDMETRVSQLENFEVQNTPVRNLQNEVAELRIEIIEAASLRGEVAELKHEVSEMRNEMVVVAELQFEVASLKREMAEMRNVMIDAGDFLGELDDLKSNMAEISTEMKEVKSMFAEMRSNQDEQQFAKRRRLTAADGEASGSVNH